MVKRSWKRKTLLGLVLLFTAVFIGGYVKTMGDYSVRMTVADDPSLPYIEINGYRFHGQTFGNVDSPTVIVVHGGPGWDYRSLLPLKDLADEYFVVFYDQRGAGLSPRVDAEQLNLATALEDLDAFVDYFGDGEPVTLIGHSWGGMLVSGYLGLAPDKVSKAVLMEPGFLNSEMFERSGIRLGPRWEFGYLAFAMRRWFESLHIDQPDSDAAGDYFIAEVAARANPEYYCEGEIPEKALQHWRVGKVAMGAMFVELRREDGGLDIDFSKGMDRFTRPVLLLASECNTLIGVEQQRRHAAMIRNSRLEMIPHSGHMMVVENPDATLAAIRSYLDEGW
ncbi:MAG: alpha/beta hydrolase [Pseudomonadota bacterium]